MIILPAIDIYEKKAVRLYKGDYSQMTVYSDDPVSVAMDFRNSGAGYVHMVDLEGARTGETPNLDVVERVVRETGLFVEIGGGIRTMETAEKYLSCGVSRIILGTAAVTDEAFLREAVKRFGDRTAVGADIKDGFVAIKGWLEKSGYGAEEFFDRMQQLGVKTVICTDVSRDGAMRGTNLELYRRLSERFSVDIIASGGVSSIEDVRELRRIGVSGAIIGKAYYTGDVDLKEAIEVAKQ